MHIVKSNRSDIIVGANIYDAGSAYHVVIRHLEDYVQSEGFPFKYYDITLRATWYDSRRKEFRYKFVLRWIE